LAVLRKIYKPVSLSKLFFLSTIFTNNINGRMLKRFASSSLSHPGEGFRVKQWDFGEALKKRKVVSRQPNLQLTLNLIP